MRQEHYMPDLENTVIYDIILQLIYCINIVRDKVQEEEVI